MPTTRADAVRLEAWRAMLTAHAEVVDRLAREVEERTGLPLSWYEVLLSLHEAPGEQLRMHRLADSLLLSRSAVTRFIDRMEAAGLVARTGCPRDGRGVNVTLTVEGRHRFAEAAPIHLEGISRRFGAFVSREEAEVIARALRRVAAANQGSG